MLTLPTFDDVLLAADRISPHIRHTPVLTSFSLDRLCGGQIFLKCENFQKTGAFKARGACNAVLSLAESTTRVATHSSGNHGAAVAYAARVRNMKATIVVPQRSNRVKVEAIRSYGGSIRVCEPGMANREKELANVVRETSAAVVHPFDDSTVIAGQGTAALELLRDVPDLDLILAPVGGGGLVSGTLLVARAQKRPIDVIGVEPERADDARRSLESGKRVSIDVVETIADGLRAPIGERNFHFIATLIDSIACVTEQEIIDAMRYIWTRMKIIVEPSSAVPVAAILGGHVNVRGKRAGLILTGGNIDPDNLPW